MPTCRLHHEQGSPARRYLKTSAPPGTLSVLVGSLTLTDSLESSKKSALSRFASEAGERVVRRKRVERPAPGAGSSVHTSEVAPSAAAAWDHGTRASSGAGRCLEPAAAAAASLHAVCSGCLLKSYGFFGVFSLSFVSSGMSALGEAEECPRHEPRPSLKRLARVMLNFVML